MPARSWGLEGGNSPPRGDAQRLTASSPRSNHAVRLRSGYWQEAGLRYPTRRTLKMDPLGGGRGRRVKVLYFSDNTSGHNQRFLEKLSQAGLDVWFLDPTTSKVADDWLPQGVHWVESGQTIR